MEVFHGTSSDSAKNIMGPPKNIDITMGRGELGMGFYVGSEPSLAASLAKGRYKANAAVLEITINNSEFVKLDLLTINRRRYLLQTWKDLLRARQTRTYQFNVDVVCAPFGTIDFSHQYKFESDQAEQFLNSSLIKKIL